MELEDETDVFVAELCQGCLAESEDILAIKKHLAFVRFVEGSHDLEEGGFACTTLSDDAHYFTLPHLQVHSFEHLQRAEALPYVFYFYHLV